MSEMVKHQGGGQLAQPAPQFGRFTGTTSADFVVPLVHLYQDTGKEKEIFGRGFDAGDLINIITLEPMVERKFVVVSGFVDYADSRKDATLKFSRNPADWPADDHKFLDRGDGKKPHPAVNERINALVLFEGHDWPVVLRFKKTSLRAGRTLNTLLSMQAQKGTVGLFEYDIKQEKSDDGPYFVPVIKTAGKAPQELADKARALFDQMNAGNVVVQDGEGADDTFDTSTMEGS